MFREQVEARTPYCLLWIRDNHPVTPGTGTLNTSGSNMEKFISTHERGRGGRSMIWRKG